MGAKVEIKSLISKYLVKENYCFENIENILYNYCHYENSKLIMIFFEEASWVKPDFFSTFAFKLNINDTVHSFRLRFRVPDKQQKRQ